MRRRAARWLIMALLLLGGGVLLLELVLRAADYGYSTQPFLKKQIRGRSLYLFNPDFLRTFNASLDTAWRWNWQVEIEEAKPAQVRRVFVLGGAAARAPGYEEQGIAPVLETLLRDRFPGLQFEVYCLAFPEADSHVARRLARAVSALEPDVILVYPGREEAADPLKIVPAAFEVQARMYLSDLRLAQWLGLDVWPQTPAERVPLSPEVYARQEERRYRNLDENLHAICEIARTAGATAILCTAGVNLRHWAPAANANASSPAPEQRESWEAAFRSGVSLEEDGDYAGAARAFETALGIDAAYAELHFRLATCLESASLPQDAREHYIRAWELDTPNLMRPAPRLNETIRGVVYRLKGSGIALADTAAALAEESPAGVPGAESFLDATATTFHGSYITARCLVEQIADSIGEETRPDGKEEAAILDEEACAARLAIAPHARALHLREILNRYRSRGLRHLEPIETALAEAEAAAADPQTPDDSTLFRTALTSNGSDYGLFNRFVRHLLDNEENELALNAAMAFLGTHPQRAAPQLLAARALACNGRAAEAAPFLDVYAQYYPQDPETALVRAHCLSVLGRTDEADAVFEEAEALTSHDTAYIPERVAVLLQQCRNYQAAGAWDAALAACRRAAALRPNAPMPWDALAELLAAADPPRPRAAFWDELAHAFPESARVLYHYAEALFAEGDTATGMDVMRRAAALSPRDAMLQMRLSTGLERAGDFAGAAEALRAVLEINPEATNARARLDALEELLSQSAETAP